MAVSTGVAARSDLSYLRERLDEAGRILVVSHIRPDGDAIGSLLSLGLSLIESSKFVHMVSPDGVPAKFSHLEGSQEIRRRPEGAYDFICLLDCSDLERAGGVLNGYGTPDLNIDHHITNRQFAVVNLVDPGAVATVEILMAILPALGLPINQAVANALMTGLLTDTIGFRTSNMTPKALRMAADLMEMGVDLPDLYRQALITRSFSAMRLWGAGLNNLQKDGRIVWTALTIEDRESALYPGRDDADLINLLVNVEDSDIALIFLEQSGGSIKVSWRSRPGFDISQVAFNFGGGGHPNAAGAMIDGTLEEVQEAVIRATHALMQEAEEQVAIIH